MGARMLKPKPKVETDYTEEFDTPHDWEQLRDGDGELMEGCYRTLPAVDSDSL